MRSIAFDFVGIAKLPMFLNVLNNTISSQDGNARFTHQNSPNLPSRERALYSRTSFLLYKELAVMVIH